MGNSKVIFGNETLIDLTGDTVTPDTLLAGTTAHNRSGEQIVGTATVPEELDDLTDVTITSAADGDLLQYNSTSGKWENSDEIPQELAATQEAGAVNHFVLTATSNVNNGITYTVDADARSVTMNGEASDTSTLILTNIANCEHLAGKNVTVDLQNSIPSVSVGFVRFVARDANNNTVYSSEQIISKSTFLLPSTAAYYLANLYIQTGQTVNNLTIKPMLYDARLVNPPYQPFTMTNRELTDAVEAVDDWEDITSQCNFAHDFFYDESFIYGISYGVHVNKKLKLCTFSMMFRTNPDSEIAFNNVISLLSMPNGYQFTTKRIFVCEPIIKDFNEATTGHSLESMRPVVMAEGRHLYMTYSVNTALYCKRLYVPMITIPLIATP